jgi:hypothetical protein
LNKDSVQKAEERHEIRTINVGSVMGTPVSMRFEMIIYSEHIEPSGDLAQGQTNIQIKLSRTPECRLVMDPMTADRTN